MRLRGCGRPLEESSGTSVVDVGFFVDLGGSFLISRTGRRVRYCGIG